MYAPTAGEAAKIRPMVKDHQVVMKTINELRDLHAQIQGSGGLGAAALTRKITKRALRSQIQGRISLLIGRLNKPITGGGPMQKSEVENIRNVIGDPTEWLTRAESVSAKFDTMESFFNNDMKSALNTATLRTADDSLIPQPGRLIDLGMAVRKEQGIRARAESTFSRQFNMLRAKGAAWHPDAKAQIEQDLIDFTRNGFTGDENLKESLREVMDPDEQKKWGVARDSATDIIQETALQQQLMGPWGIGLNVPIKFISNLIDKLPD